MSQQQKQQQVAEGWQFALQTWNVEGKSIADEQAPVSWFVFVLLPLFLQLFASDEFRFFQALIILFADKQLFLLIFWGLCYDFVFVLKVCNVDSVSFFF